MAITSTGFGSGLPINDLVSQLVNAEAAPATNRLDRREARLQTELSAIGILKGGTVRLPVQLQGAGRCG